MSKPTKQFRTLVNRQHGRLRYAIDYEPFYWQIGLTVGNWYLRFDIGPYGITVVKTQ